MDLRSTVDTRPDTGSPSTGSPGRSGSRWRTVAVALALLLGFVLAACGADDDSTDAGASRPSGGDAETAEFSGSDGDAEDSSDESGDFAVETDDEAMEDEPAMEEPASAPEGETEGAGDTATDSDSDADADSLGAGGARVTPAAVELGRKLIFTAVLQVEVDDVAAASAEATTIIENMGGFLFGQNTVGGAQARSELTFKVLPADFNRALEELGTVGELRNQSVTTDDVTERIVDLDSRIQVAELGVARLREALTGSTTLEDYAQLERLLLDRESDLEVMRGQIRTLQDRVDLATITLGLTQERVENALTVQVSTYEGFDAGLSCPGQEGTFVEEGGDLTVCFDVVNIGDQTLTNIVLTDTVLEIGPDTQLLPVFGSLDELPPGQSALVAFETRPERDLRLRTRVTAIPTDGVSPERAGPSVSTQVNYEIRTFEPDEDPGFNDGFEVGKDIVKGLWVALKVTVGFLILPLLVLAPLLWLVWMLWRAVRSRRPVRSTPPPPGPWSGGEQTPPDPPGDPVTPADPNEPAEV